MASDHTVGILKLFIIKHKNSQSRTSISLSVSVIQCCYIAVNYPSVCGTVGTHMCVLSHCHVLFFVMPWTVANQAPLSMGILQERILERVAISSSRGSNSGLLYYRQILYCLSHQGSPSPV